MPWANCRHCRLVDWNMATRIGPEQRARIERHWPTLCDAMAAGEVMAPVYGACGVTADQVRVWRQEDVERIRQWDQAREQSADAYADKVAAIVSLPGADSGLARVQIDGLKWLASKRNPRAYSDKATLDVNVRTVDLTRIIQDANARLAAARTAHVVEGAVAQRAIEGIRAGLNDSDDPGE